MENFIFIVLILIQVPFVLFKIGIWQVNLIAMIFIGLLLLDTLLDYKISNWLGL